MSPEQASLLGQVGRALGVVAIDINADGWIDLFVARDASPNLLLLNQKNGTFRDAAFETEVAYNADGVARAGMGVEPATSTEMAHRIPSPTSIRSTTRSIRIAGSCRFARSHTLRLAAFTKPYVGWGVRFSTMTTMAISIC